MTKAEQVTKPLEARGGILADEMGTGKTLTLLAVVVHTLDEARLQHYRSLDNQVQSRARLCSGATLIIAPKSSMFTIHSCSLSGILLNLLCSIVQLGVRG